MSEDADGTPAPALDLGVIAGLEEGLTRSAVDDVLRTFVLDLKRRRERLAGLDPDADRQELSSLAHGLKGSGNSFGAPALAASAESLESAMAAGDGVESGRKHLIGEIERAVDAVQGWLDHRWERPAASDAVDGEMAWADPRF